MGLLTQIQTSQLKAYSKSNCKTFYKHLLREPIIINGSSGFKGLSMEVTRVAR